ncbi:MAG: hypothetical protein ACLFU0_09395 [Alphaproteobacteria bacterium]
MTEIDDWLVLQVPHRLPPRAYSGFGLDDLLRRHEAASLDDVEERVRDDMSFGRLMTSKADFDELRAHLKDPKYAPAIGIGGPPPALAALEREASRIGWLELPDDDEDEAV